MPRKNILNEEITLRDLIFDFCDLTECKMRNPLSSILQEHIVTDTNLVNCYRYLLVNDFGFSVRAIGTAVITQLMLWTEAERYAFFVHNSVLDGVGKVLVKNKNGEYSLVDFTKREY